MKKIYLFIILALMPLISMCSGPYGPMRDGYGGMMGGYGYGYGGMFMGILFLILAGGSDLLYCSKCKVEEWSWAGK